MIYAIYKPHLYWNEDVPGDRFQFMDGTLTFVIDDTKVQMEFDFIAKGEEIYENTDIPTLTIFGDSPQEEAKAALEAWLGDRFEVIVLGDDLEDMED